MGTIGVKGDGLGVIRYGGIVLIFTGKEDTPFPIRLSGIRLSVMYHW
jgi:hypothetical protein